MSVEVDVAVVGGGPVGLAAALTAARRGLSVVVLEPRHGPVDKACGEGLMPGAVAALAALGVDPSGQPITGIRYLAGGGRQAVADFRDGPGRGVRRTVLHAALSRAVEEAGVEVRPVGAGHLAQDDDGVTVTTRERDRTAAPVRAAHVLAADGLHSPIRRALGLDLPSGGSTRYGLRQHHAIAPWSKHVEVHWGPTAEAYVTPVAPDLVGVAVLTRSRAGYDALLQQFPLLLERLQGAAGHGSELRGAGPLRQRSRRRVEGRVLLVGDASGYVDALTGEGISLGIAQAAEAVEAVAAGCPQRYERGWRRVSWRYTLLTQGLVQATRPAWVRRAIVPAASAARPVFAGAVHELGRVR